MAGKKIFTDHEYQTSAHLVTPKVHTVGNISGHAGVLGQLVASGNNLYFHDGSNWFALIESNYAGALTGRPNFDPGTGNIPFTVGTGHTDRVDNLNADLLDGYDTSTSAVASKIPVYGSSGVLKVGTPVATGDATTKAYVDDLVQGLDIKASVAAATTGSITLSGTQTIDGTTITAGMRVLVKDQSVASQNGIYICQSGSWALAEDSDSGSLSEGAYVFVEAGTVNNNTGWTYTDSSAYTWAQFSGAGQLNAGDGLVKSGDTLNANVAAPISIVSDQLTIADAAITGAKLANNTVTSTQLADSIQLNHTGLGVAPDTTYRLKTTGKSRLYNTTDFALLAETTGSNTAIFNATSAPPNYIVDFRLAGNSKVRIEPDGDLHAVEKISVGSGSPVYDVHVQRANARIAADNGTVETLLQSDSTIGYVGTNTNHKLILKTNNSSRIEIENDGTVKVNSKLGVGMAPSADSTAIINGTLQATMGRFSGWTSTGNSGTGLGLEVGISSGDGYVMAYDRTAGAYSDLRLVSNASQIHLSDVSGGSIEMSGAITLNTLATSTTDTNVIVENSGLLKKRTANSGIWTTNLGANRLLVSNSSGVITSDSNFIHLGGRVSLTGAIDGGANLKVDIVDHDVTTNDTNYEKAIYAYAGAGYNIASGVTDSGYRIAVDASAFVSDSDFQGTLNQQYAVWARHGANTSASGSTITSSYGVFIDTLTNSNTSITNLYAIYQQSSAAKNFFAGSVGIGTTGSYTISEPLTIANSTNAGIGLKSTTTQNSANVKFYNQQSLKWTIEKYGSGHTLAIKDAGNIAAITCSQGGSVSLGNLPTSTTDTNVIVESSGLLKKRATHPGAFETTLTQGATNLNSVSGGWHKWGSSGTKPLNSPNQYMVMLQHPDTNQDIQLAYGGSGYGKLFIRRKDSGTFYDWTEFYSTENLTLSTLGGVGGSGTIGKIPLWSGSTTTLGNSVMTQNATDRVTVSGGLVLTGNYTDTGNQLNLWCNSSGHGYAAVYDLAIKTGSNDARTTKWAISNTGEITSGHTNYKIKQTYSNGNSSALLYSSTTGNFELRGSETDYAQLYLKSGGNVGIGTASPDAKLHISQSSGATIRLESTTTTLSTGGVLGAIEFETRDAGSEGVNSKINSVFENTVGATSLQFFTSPSFNTVPTDPQMVIDSSGNCGIGTAAPNKQLHLRGSAPFLRIEENSASSKRLDLWVDPSTAISYIGANQSGQKLILQTGNADRLEITNAGNVGIGVSSSLSAKLQVLKSDTGEAFRINGASDGFAMIVEGGTSYRTRMRGGVTIGNGYGASTPPANGLIVEGNCGIGTDDPAYLLSLDGDANDLTKGLLHVEHSGSYIGTSQIQQMVRLVGKSNTENSGNTPSGGTSLDFYNRWIGNAPYSVARIVGRASQGYNGGLQFDVGSNSGNGQSGFSTAMTILANGNCGIGVNEPSVKLHVIGDIASSTRVAVDTINGYTGGSTPLTIRTGGAQSLFLGTNNTNRVEVTSAGAVKATRDGGSNLIQVARIFDGSLTGNESATSFTVTHNLETEKPIAVVIDHTSGAYVEAQIVVASDNAITVTFNNAPASGKVYRVPVTG